MFATFEEIDTNRQELNSGRLKSAIDGLQESMDKVRKNLEDQYSPEMDAHVRDYLLEEQERKLDDDAKWMEKFGLPL